MQAILTKYIPATNYKPSRIKAWCERGSITIGYPHEASGGVEGAHTTAAKALTDKFVAEDLKRWDEAQAPHLDKHVISDSPWNDPMICGGLPNNTGFCFVFLPRCYQALHTAAIAANIVVQNERPDGSIAADLCKALAEMPKH
jgi:hypothetical protein